METYPEEDDVDDAHYTRPRIRLCVSRRTTRASQTCTRRIGKTRLV